MTSRNFLSSIFNGTRGVFFALVVLAAGVASAGAAEEKPLSRNLTDKTSEALGKLDPILKASNWDTAIVMLKGILADAPAGSYDKALGSFILSQVYLQHAQGNKDKKVTEADYAAAIPLFDYVIHSGYYDRTKQLEFIFILAQLQLQAGDMVKALAYAKEWVDTNPKPNAEGLVFYYTILYQLAQADSKKIDLEKMKQIVEGTSKALRMFTKPNESLYLLRAVSLQALDRLEEASEVLELMVERYPKNSQYWSQLYAVYANLSQLLRAAITIERAQAAGLMSSPKENLTLATLYYNLEQLNKAGELLDKGLRAGTIESERSTWELLGFVYQRTNRELKAIDTYIEASKRFKIGQFDATIGTLYYALANYPKALEFAENALTKGELESEFQTAMFATYVAFELKQFPVASKHIKRAESAAKTDKERDQLVGLKNAVNDALKQMEPPAEKPAEPPAKP